MATPNGVLTMRFTWMFIRYHGWASWNWRKENMRNDKWIGLRENLQQTNPIKLPTRHVWWHAKKGSGAVALKAMSSVWVQISPQIHHPAKNAKTVAESRGRPGSNISMGIMDFRLCLQWNSWNTSWIEPTRLMVCGALFYLSIHQEYSRISCHCIPEFQNMM